MGYVPWKKKAGWGGNGCGEEFPGLSSSEGWEQAPVRNLVCHGQAMKCTPCPALVSGTVLGIYSMSAHLWVLGRSGSQIVGWSGRDFRGYMKAPEDPHLYLNLILRTSSWLWVDLVVRLEGLRRGLCVCCEWQGCELQWPGPYGRLHFQSWPCTCHMLFFQCDRHIYLFSLLGTGWKWVNSLSNRMWWKRYCVGSGDGIAQLPPSQWNGVCLASGHKEQSSSDRSFPRPWWLTSLTRRPVCPPPARRRCPARPLPPRC